MEISSNVRSIYVKMHPCEYLLVKGHLFYYEHHECIHPSISHHMASVNVIQLHYVIGFAAWLARHGMNGVMLCQLWLKIILL